MGKKYKEKNISMKSLDNSDGNAIEVNDEEANSVAGGIDINAGNDRMGTKGVKIGWQRGNDLGKSVDRNFKNGFLGEVKTGWQKRNNLGNKG